MLVEVRLVSDGFKYDLVKKVVMELESGREL